MNLISSHIQLKKQKKKKNKKITRNKWKLMDIRHIKLIIIYNIDINITKNIIMDRYK